MKLHLPKALAAAVMALFAIPNALADVTFTETSTLTKGVDYFLPYAKGAIELTLSDSFSGIADNTSLVTAKAQSGTTPNTMAIVTDLTTVTSGDTETTEVRLHSALEGTKRTASNITGTGSFSGVTIKVSFDGSGTKAYEVGTTSETEIYSDPDLKYTDNAYSQAYTYTVSNIAQIDSASFSDTSVTIINSITGSGDLAPTSGKTALIIENCGNSGVNLNLSGRSLSVAGSVTLGNITSSSSIGSGIFVASGASLSTQSITCAYSPGNMIIHGVLNNAGNLILTSGTQNTTNLKGVGELTVASILTHNGGRLNSSLAKVHVTGNVDLGGATITEGQPATNDILTVSGGAFTVDGTTNVQTGRSFNISGGTTTLTGAVTVSGTMTVSGGTNTLSSLSVSGSMTLSGGTTTLTGAATVDGTMTVSGGTTTATSVTVADGGVLKLVTKSDAQSKLRATNGLTVQSGGQLQFTAQDVTGYNGGNTSLKKITIEEGGELWLNHNENETFAGELNLAGTLRGKGTNESGKTTLWDFYNNSATLKVADGVTSAKVENLTLRLRAEATTFTIGNGSMLTIGDIENVHASSTLTVTGAGNGCGTLAVTGAATLNNLSVSGASGAVSFTGSTLSAAKIHTTGNNASVTIGDDTHNVVATVGRFELGDNSTNGVTSLTIASESKVIVTGNDTAGDNAYKNAGIVLGEYNNTTTAQIAGNLVAANASIQPGDKGYTAEISETGLVAVKGLYSSKGSGTIAVTLNGGKLILGENGVQRGTVTLNGGRIGSFFTATDTASMTIAGSVVLSNSTTTVFDTNLYSLNTTSGQDNYGTVTRSETDGTTIKVTGALSGNGTIEATGKGILTLAGNINVGAIKGAEITNITGQIKGGDVQDVNILATQSNMGTATLGGTINFDVQNGTFTHGDETYSTTTGVKKVTRVLTLLANVDATRFTSATFKVNGATPTPTDLSIDTNGIRGTFTSDTTTYLIAGASDEISWSTVQAAGCDSVEFSAGGKLKTASTDIVNSSAIEVQNGVTGSSLSGSGKYVLESGSTDIKVGSLTDWTGTVALSGTHTESLDLGSSKLSNTDSTILINGVTAQKLANATVNANVKLDASDNDGLTITGTGATVTFNGNVTGVVADIKTAINILNRALGTELNFTGAENTGVRIIDEKGSSISFSGDATDISTSIVSQRDAFTGKTSVSFDNTAAVSMRGEIRNDKWYKEDRPDDVPKGDLSVNLSENTKVAFSGKVHATTLDVSSGAEASFSAEAKLNNLIGSGALKASGGATTSVEDASKFTGTLMTTEGSLLIEKASRLVAINAASSGGIWLTDSASSVTVDEIVLSGSRVGVYYTIPADPDTGSKSSVVEATVSTGSLTVRGTSTSTLLANLELKANGTLELDSALAMGSTLTLGSGITLSGSLLTAWQSDRITLFSGVDSFNGNTAETSVTASSIFSNAELAEGAGGYNYKVLYGGGDNAAVELVRTATPEPTTATLSMLVLMGLAARRRRKAAK